MAENTEQAITIANTTTLIDTIYHSICGQINPPNPCFDYYAIISRVDRLATLNAELD